MITTFGLLTREEEQIIEITIVAREIMNIVKQIENETK